MICVGQGIGTNFNKELKDLANNVIHYFVIETAPCFLFSKARAGSETMWLQRMILHRPRFLYVLLVSIVHVS